jgi:hypothetical protein
MFDQILTRRYEIHIAKYIYLDLFYAFEIVVYSIKPWLVATNSNFSKDPLAKFCYKYFASNNGKFDGFFLRKNPLGPFFNSLFCVAMWQIFATKKNHIDNSNK